MLPHVAFTELGWQGITGQKNEMGQLSALFVLALLVAPGWQDGRRKWLALGAALGVVALGLSRSSTSVVALMAALGVLATYRFVHLGYRRPAWALCAYFGAVGLAMLAHGLFIFDALPAFDDVLREVLAVFGKSDTFTGRTHLWDLVMAQSTYRSDIIGGGYGGFWDISFERVRYIISQLGFGPIQAHNGYLDIFNDLGLIGLVIAAMIVGTYVLSLFSSWGLERSDREFLLLMLVFIATSNLSESSLLRTTNFLNLVFLASLFFLAARQPRQSQSA